MNAESKADFICSMNKYFNLINSSTHSHDIQVVYLRSMYLYMLQNIDVLKSFTERQRFRFICCVLRKSNEFLKRVQDPVTTRVIRDVQKMYSSYFSRL